LDFAEVGGTLEAQDEPTEEQRGQAGIEMDGKRQPNDQREADDQIEKTPEEIHHRGGVADAGGLGERSRKGPALQAADEVRNGVAEECSGKKQDKKADDHGEGS